jgi:hypothetical protein
LFWAVCFGAVDPRFIRRKPLFEFIDGSEVAIESIAVSGTQLQLQRSGFRGNKVHDTATVSHAR